MSTPEYYKKLAEEHDKIEQEHKIISCGYLECHSHKKEDEEFCVVNHYEPNPHDYIDDKQIQFLFVYLNNKIDKLQKTIDTFTSKKI